MSLIEKAMYLSALCLTWMAILLLTIEIIGRF